MPSGGQYKTHEQFQKEFSASGGEEYTLLSTYVSAKTKIDVRHNACQFTYQVTPSHFLNGTRCPNCYGTNRKTTEQYKKQVFAIFGADYSVESEYINAKTKVTIKHNVCQSTYEVYPFSVLKGHGCPMCAGRHRYTDKTFKKEVFRLVGDEYEVISPYQQLNKKVTMRHQCGYTYEVMASKFLSGTRCPTCAGNIQKSTETFSKELEDKYPGEYKLLSAYISAKHKVRVQHTVCGHTYEVTPDNILRGRQCRYCTNMSAPEKLIYDFLVVNGLSFEVEYTFEELKHETYLRFDFKINVNDVEFFLLEYDGFHHYQSWRSDQSLDSVRNRDKMKDDYCLANNIRLIRIPYWEDAIEQLTKELAEYGIGTNDRAIQLSLDLD